MRKRTGRQPRFAAIPNATIDDATNLDLTALGLLAVLLRHRDGWEITLKDIGARYGYGEGAMARAMGLLQVARYVVKIRIRDKSGHWSTEVVVYDTPATDQEIADLVAAVRTEPGVCDVRIVEPTTNALAYAARRRARLTESGFSGTRCDLRKHHESPGRTESWVCRDSVNPRVPKKTVKKKTKNSSSPYPLTDVQEQPAHRPQEEEEEGIPQTDHHGATGGTPSDLLMCHSDTGGEEATPERDTASAGGSRTSAATGDHGEAAALVADLPTLAARAGRPLARALRADETNRLTALVAAALARGWTAEQIRAVLADDLRGARSPVATWHARLSNLGNPPADEPAPAAPPKCGRCNPFRWIEDDEGRPLERCPTCHPGLAGRRATA